MGRLRIKNDPDWRNTCSSGVWEADQPVADGTYTVEGIDPNDGDLSDSARDSRLLKGTGSKGIARQKLQVTPDPATVFGHYETGLNANFNPPGTPYLGQVDQLPDDQYPFADQGVGLYY